MLTVCNLLLFFPFHLTEKCHPGQHLDVDLYLTPGSCSKQRSVPRYSLTVVDITKASGKNGKFAIFIVPQGATISFTIPLKS